MIEDLDYNKIIEELQGDNYGDYPAELVKNTLAEGAPSG